MTDLVKSFRRLGRGGRNYAAAALLNLALVNTVLTPPQRAGGAQTRVVAHHNDRRFADAECVTLPDGATGVLSLPFELVGSATTIGEN